MLLGSQNGNKMTLRAFIRPPDKAGLSRVVIAFHYKGKQWIKTDIKVLPGSWNQVGQYIEATQPLHKKLNARLAEVKTEIKHAIETLAKNKIEPSTATVTDFMAPKPVAVVEVKTAPTLSYLLKDFSKSNRNKLSKNYCRKFDTIAWSLDEYKPGLIADEFTLHECEQYIEHLIEKCDVENNTIHDYIKRVVRILKLNKIKGITNNTHFLEFNVKFIDPKPFWLDWSDVEKIEKFIPAVRDRVYKDEFLFRCYTGLRWSDAHQLKPYHFIIVNGIDIYYDFSVIKTKLSQNILMPPKAVEILKRWDFKIPHLYDSDCNERIKIIAENAGITEVTEKIRFKGSKRIVELLPKCKLVTTHVARRTFARRWLDLGGDLIKLSKYLGHSSTEQTLHYAGYTTKEVNDELRKLWG